VVAVYVDNDRSASSRKPREQFTRMLEDAVPTAAGAGQFDVIVAWHLDRLTRTLRDFLPLQALAHDHKVKVCTVAGDLDMTTDAGEMVAGILTVVAHGEVKRKGARQALAARQRAQQGKPAPGPRPLGYEADMVTLRPSEAAAIRHAYKVLLAGGSTSSIARDLNGQGLTTSQGKPWTHHSVRTLLRNPRYAGLRAHHGEVVGSAVWTPVVDEETWRGAVALLGDARRRTNLRPGGERTRLLTGIARCGVCDDGTTVLGGSRGDGTHTYQCRNGKHLSRAAAPIESAVARVLLERVAAPDARDLLADPAREDVHALRGEMVTIQARIAAVQAEFVRDDATTPGWLRDTMAALEMRRGEVESRMVHTNRSQVLGDLVNAPDPAEVWAQMPLSRRRAAVGMLMEITIMRGRAGGSSPRNGSRRLDPQTVQITPRG
jgi:site-specific DNA recombinase